MLTLLIPGETEVREVALVGEQLTVGRTYDNDVVLPSAEGVSRRHFVLRREGFKWFIEDFGSALGTFVNEERITQRRELAVGDVVRIGGYRHQVQVLQRELDRDTLGKYAALTLATDEQHLVHADELEQRGELDFANWLRAELELRTHSPFAPEHRQVQERLAELAKKVPPHLRALVTHGRIEGCGLTKCPGDWAKLAMGTDPRTRGRATCHKTVTYCDTTAEGRDLFPNLIVIDPSRERRPYDTRPRAPMVPVG